MAERSTSGVSRRVFFQAWCSKCGWKGTERDMKSMAAYDMAGHNIDNHGGSWRIGE